MSGMSDHQWCLQHDIRHGTFYNWVSRNKKRDDVYISSPGGAGEYWPEDRLDIVRIELNQNRLIVTVQPAELSEAAVVSSTVWRSILRFWRRFGHGWINSIRQKDPEWKKAVNYVRNRWGNLETYLEDGLCSFSNNLSENAFRPFTVGRRNWLFSDTPKDAEASATVYTMVEMAKAHGLSIYDYLKFLLEHCPSSQMTDEELEQFAPWNEKVKQVCGNTANREELKM